MKKYIYKKLFLSCVLLLNLPLFIHALTIQSSVHPVNQTTVKLTISISMNPNEYLYQDSLKISSGSPYAQVTSWSSLQETTDLYDPQTDTKRKIFKGEITLQVVMFFQPGYTQEEVPVTVMYWSNQGPGHDVVIVPGLKAEAPKARGVFMAKNESRISDIATHLDVGARVIKNNEDEEKKIIVHKPAASWSDYVSELVQKSNSLWVRLLAVFVLGLLLSLTPCIYPMVPITVGILQTHKSNSVWYSFLLSSIYTAGIATTFALLGLMAAFTGQMIGQFLANPFVIIGIIGVLTYLAGSMFGWYEMYTPRFLANNKVSVKGGSYLSIFLFGAASGCVASPCISPGLILLLTIVSTLGNTFLGFVLLFVFGVGLSMPLLIIGTFSSSLQVLPNAGMWMVEVKKFFGFLLLGMNFYFLNMIIPPFYGELLFGLFVLVSGVYILAAMVKRHEKGIWAVCKRLLGIALVASAPLVCMHAFKARGVKAGVIWLTNFENAQQQGIKENKRVMLDMSAPFCGICKAIEETVFVDPHVIRALEHFVLIKLDDPCQEIYSILQKKYDVKGVPALLLIDANTGELLARWAGELYKKPIEEFVAELELLSKR